MGRNGSGRRLILPWGFLFEFKFRENFHDPVAALHRTIKAEDHGTVAFVDVGGANNDGVINTGGTIEAIGCGAAVTPSAAPRFTPFTLTMT